MGVFSAKSCLADLPAGAADIRYFPTMCDESLSFSLHTYSNKSVLSLMCWRSVTVQGAV